ncbi:MAG: hypothetical protein K0R57_3031 [Paenibacillaceae bacterium]|jgi:hypothetical protein|nr:hypothetical protein [Paenibacillaceae bacterium]
MVYMNPYQLAIRTILAGQDYVLLITGGEAHIGAVAVSRWDGQAAVTEHLTLPKHKEGELARELAGLACSCLQATVTVIAGIHIDNAAKEEILFIVDEVRAMVRLELEVLLEQRNRRRLPG